MIAVEDDGPGMAEAMNGHLFEPFYTTKASGTGLGLSVARKLAEALEADLRFMPYESARHARRAAFLRTRERHTTEQRESHAWNVF